MKRIQFGQRGLTMIELMVSLAIGLVVVLALLTLLINVNRNNAEMSRTNSVIENGRFALQLLEADVSHAGFWGGYVPTFDDKDYTGTDLGGGTSTTTTIVFPTTVPDPCPNNGTTWTQPSAWTADYKAQLISMPVQVYSVPNTGISPVCRGTASLQGPLYSDVQPSTDVLVVRHAAPCEASFTATDDDCKLTASNSAGSIFFQASHCSRDLTVAAGALTTSGAASATTGNWALTTDPLYLTLRTAKCSSANTALTSAGCFTSASPPVICAPLYRFTSTIYWVRSYFVSSGDGIPTLMRTRMQLSGGVMKHQLSEALVDGIESFRVELGLDNKNKSGTTLTAASFTGTPTFASTSTTYTPTNRGDGNIDSYISCATGTGSTACYDATNATTLGQSAFNLANTVAVKLNVLVRASSVTPGKAALVTASWCASPPSPFTAANPPPECRKFTVGGSTLGPFYDGYKRHVYTETVRLNNVSMRREVPPGT